MIEHKILFTGTTGAGKTTAIGGVSEVPPISTDVRNTDSAFAKAMTTAGLDYGELTLDNGETLRLYGTPGQQRFDFMWRILVEQALGLVILIDNSRPDPLADLRVYLDAFADLLPTMNCAIGVGRTLECPVPTLDDFADLLAERDLAIPTLAVDVRERDDVLLLIDAILSQAEAAA